MPKECHLDSLDRTQSHNLQGALGQWQPQELMTAPQPPLGRPWGALGAPLAVPEVSSNLEDQRSSKIEAPRSADQVGFVTLFK